MLTGNRKALQPENRSVYHKTLFSGSVCYTSLCKWAVNVETLNQNKLININLCFAVRFSDRTAVI